MKKIHVRRIFRMTFATTLCAFRHVGLLVLIRRRRFGICRNERDNAKKGEKIARGRRSRSCRPSPVPFAAGNVSSIRERPNGGTRRRWFYVVNVDYSSLVRQQVQPIDVIRETPARRSTVLVSRKKNKRTWFFVTPTYNKRFDG